MIRKRIPKLFGLLASAACIFGVGLTVTPITHAAPCTDWVFNGNTTVLEVPAAWTIAFASDNKLVPDTVTFTKPPGSDASDGPAPGGGGINGSGINMLLNGIQFNGNIDQNGNASGSTVFPTPGPNDPHWKLSGPLKCNTPVAPASTHCPDGAVKPDVVPPETCAPPTNAVTMNISRNGLTNARVEIINNGNLGGRCSYDASSDSGLLPSVSRTVDVAPKGGKATITDLLWPPLGSTYHVVLSCNGNYDGQQVEFGHVEQNVSSF
jgi:hypothetical protein